MAENDSAPIRAADGGIHATTPKLAIVGSATFGETEIEAAGKEGGGKVPSFSMVANTGVPMWLNGWKYRVILDFDGANIPDQRLPIRLGHDADQGVGHTTSIGFVEGNLVAAGLVSRDTPWARDVVGSAKNGFPWQTSVGASADEVDFVRAGETVTVNGRQYEGPLNVSRKWTLGEISFCDRGADTSTSATVAASHSPGTGGSNPMAGFDSWISAKGFDPTAINDTQKAALKLAYDAEQATVNAAGNGGGKDGGAAFTPPPSPASNTPPAQSFDQLVAQRKANIARQERIKEISSRWMNDRPGRIDDIDRITKLAMASESTAPEAFELAMYQEMLANNVGPAIHSHDRGGETNGKVVEAIVAASAGLRSPEKYYDERTLNLAYDRWPNGIKLGEFLQVAAKSKGHTSVSLSDARGLLRAAFSDIRAGGFSTIDVSGILSNIGNKMVRVAFEAVESAWREIAEIQRLSDFKAHTTYALTGDLQYEKVGAGQEIPHGTLGELSYTLRADTYGRMLAITRQDILNDDLSALNRIPTRLGRGAALKINDVFWTEFLAGVAANFWTSGQGNYFEGAATILQSSSLKTALQTFRKQTDPNGKPLAVTPKILLVPPELEITADELMTSTAVNTGGSSTDAKVPNRNVWLSKFRTVMSTYLSNTAYTGSSATAWYLLADPADLPAITIGFLNGRELPIVESAEADFDKLGIQYRGYHDFGVARQEYRASVRSKGAA